MPQHTTGLDFVPGELEKFRNGFYKAAVWCLLMGG